MTDPDDNEAHRACFGFCLADCDHEECHENNEPAPDNELGGEGGGSDA